MKTHELIFVGFLNVTYPKLFLASDTKQMSLAT